MLYVLDQSDPNWWKARCNDKEGLVPFNYGAPLRARRPAYAPPDRFFVFDATVSENTETIDNPMHEASKRGAWGEGEGRRGMNGVRSHIMRQLHR